MKKRKLATSKRIFWLCAAFAALLIALAVFLLVQCRSGASSTEAPP